MMITGINAYTPIRQAQSFGKKKSAYTDFVTASHEINRIKKRIAEIKKGQSNGALKEELNKLGRELKFHEDMRLKFEDQLENKFGGVVEHSPYILQDVLHKKAEDNEN